MRLNGALAAGERGKEWAGYLLRLFSVGVRREALDGDNADCHIANLALFLSNRYPDERPPSLMPDEIVRRLMPQVRALLPAAAGPDDWRELPIEQMRRLRRAKNLLRPLVELSDEVVDPKLRDDLNKYRRVLPKLP